MKTTETWKTKLAATGLAVAFVSVAHATFNPIPITPDSFTADVVVEQTATPSLVVATTASVDQGTNNGANTWNEVGYDLANPGNGLPAPGTVIVALSNANYSFQMPPSYTTPNGILINASQVTNGSFTLVTPATYTLLSFLGSGGNGGDVIGVTIRHQDGSVQTGGSFPCPDWFGGTLNLAYIAGGRVSSTVNLTSSTHGDNPRLYFRDIAVANTTSAITNVELYYVSGLASSHNDIVAMSGATTPGGAVAPIAVTGYTYDFVVEAGAAKRGRTVSTTILDGTNVWATTHSMDNTGNTANSWYEQGFNLNNPNGGGVPIPDPTVITNTGLPTAGSTLTNPDGDRAYTMPASYAANNAVYLTPEITNATITLVAPFSAVPTAPATAAALSFLASAGSGQQTPGVVINYQDGTSQTNVLVVPDWFNTTASFVYGANGRVAVDTAQFNNVRNANRQPRLFNCDIILANTTSSVTNILLNYTNTGGRMAVFAVSGTTEPIRPVFVTQPQSITVAVGANVQLTANAVANSAVTYQWQKGTNAVWVNLADGGNISGATTATLSVNNVGDLDDADYRVVATGNAGSANSGVAVLTVISDLLDVTIPSDAIVAYQPNGGSSPGGEPVSAAINDTLLKYLNFGNGVSPVSVPLGFVVTPSAGRTIVNAMRLYTANDAAERDPANVILEGSDNGGATWTLIYSNLVTMPAGRGDEGNGVPVDPLVHDIRQIRFANTGSYSSYRWYTTRVKGNAAIMQIGEVELLGVVDSSNPSPFFVSQPAAVTAYDESFAGLSAFATGTPAPDLFWLKGTNGSYVLLADGGSVSGSQSANLSINPVDFSDAADYVCVATNTAGAVTSAVAHLTVISTNLDVTAPGDPTTFFGDLGAGSATAAAPNPDPGLALDNLNTISYINNGQGTSAQAGFPPFAGPCGFTVTPAAGSTRVVGLRIYPGAANAERDPMDYLLEGSNNGGATWVAISSGPLALPIVRADNAQGFDPTLQPMQEILFANSAGFTSYRLTFNNVRDSGAANSLQIGEIELLGVAAPASPVLTFSFSGGTLTVSSTVNGVLQSSTNLTTGNWKDEGPITGSVNIVPTVDEPVKFFRVATP